MSVLGFNITTYYNNIVFNNMFIGIAYRYNIYNNIRASLMAQMVKNLPAIQETWVQSPGQEDPLEKEMSTHSSVFAWKIPWT